MAIDAKAIAKLNCAGQECAERGQCRRYRERLISGFAYYGDLKMPRFEWASFDLERLALGKCVSFVKWRIA